MDEITLEEALAGFSEADQKVNRATSKRARAYGLTEKGRAYGKRSKESAR